MMESLNIEAHTPAEATNERHGMLRGIRAGLAAAVLLVCGARIDNEDNNGRIANTANTVTSYSGSYQEGIDSSGAQANQPAVRLLGDISIVAPTEYTVPADQLALVAKDTISIPGCSGTLVREENVREENGNVIGFSTAGHCGAVRSNQPITVYMGDRTMTGPTLVSSSIIDKCKWGIKSRDSNNRPITGCTSETEPMDIAYGGLNGHDASEVEARMIELYNSIDWEHLPPNTPLVLAGFTGYNNPNKDKMIFQLSLGKPLQWVFPSMFHPGYGNWAVNEHSCSGGTSGGGGWVVVPGRGLVYAGLVLETYAEFNPVVTMLAFPGVTAQTGENLLRDFQFYNDNKLDAGTDESEGTVEFMCGMQSGVFKKV